MVSDKALLDGMAWSAEDYSMGFQVDYTMVRVDGATPKKVAISKGP